MNDRQQPEASPLAVGRREAASMLGISERMLWAWTRSGRIPHVRIGTRVLYPVNKLQAWLDEQSTKMRSKGSFQSTNLDG